MRKEQAREREPVSRALGTSVMATARRQETLGVAIFSTRLPRVPKVHVANAAEAAFPAERTPWERRYSLEFRGPFRKLPQNPR